MSDGMSISGHCEPDDARPMYAESGDYWRESACHWMRKAGALEEERDALTEQLEGAVDLLDALDRYVGHREDCNLNSGAPECSCGFEDLYVRVRATVRRGR